MVGIGRCHVGRTSICDSKIQNRSFQSNLNWYILLKVSNEETKIIVFYCLTRKNLNYLAKQGLYIYNKERRKGRNKEQKQKSYTCSHNSKSSVSSYTRTHANLHHLKTSSKLIETSIKLLSTYTD